MIKIKKFEFVYLMALALYDFISIAQISKLITLDNSIITLCYFFIALLITVSMCLKKIKLKDFIVYGIGATLAIYSYVMLKSALLLFSFLFFIAIKKVNIKKVLIVDFIVKTIFIFFNVSLYLINLKTDSNFLSTVYLSYSIDGSLRHTLYFTHPNSAGSVITWWIIDMLLIFGQGKKYIISIAAVILELACYYFTKSRTSLVALILFVAIFQLYQFKILEKILDFLKKYLLLIVTSINVTFAVFSELLGTQTFNLVNKLLSKRLSYSVLAVNKYGINFLPNYINDNYLDNVLWVDNFYIRSLINYGWIVLLILNILYWLIKKNDYKVAKEEKTILIIFPFLLISELYPFNLGRTICLLVLANIIMNGNEKELKNEIEG